MKNPYTILGVSQDAEKGEIMKAQMFAMKKKEYSLQEIHIATKQLLDPAKRLAADFMFPAKIRARRMQLIQSKLTYREINVNVLNENAFDSLK
ncbi:MAG: molecular chaperone DnaJ [Clostridiales bacterium]|jgi:DnaJ-class molecular chaperone|nr:molecular chaperone DnaJ [Clostridiales bacterium]